MARRGKMGGMGGAVLPVLASGVLTVGGTLGLRAFLTPEPGTVSEKLYRWAPLAAGGLGALSALAFYFMGGKTPAIQAGVVTVLGAAGLLASEQLNASKPGAMLALAGGAGAASGTGTQGLAALVPETAGPGMGAIVFDQVRGATPGDVVSLQGNIDTNAFGQPAF